MERFNPCPEGFNPVSRAVFRFYLRRHEILTRYVEWLAGAPQGGAASAPARAVLAMNRLLLAVISRGITRYVLVGRILSLAEAEAALEATDAFGLTDCVCRACHDAVRVPSCLFLGDACAEYERSGPYPLRRVSRADARGMVRAAYASGCMPIMPASPLRVGWFPRHYCICSCRLDSCLPLRFARRYGIGEAVAQELPSYSALHRVVLCLALAAIPVLWGSLIQFRIARCGPGRGARDARAAGA